MSHIQDTDQSLSIREEAVGPMSSESSSTANGNLEDAYRYEKLPSQGDFIRLFELLPGDALSGRLSIVELTPETRYEALSYTWGQPEPCGAVECDGCHMPIGRNLAGALSRLKRRDQPRIIWADALCIDQNDHEERAQQVRLMRKVYEYADCVVVDFGEDKENLAADTFQMIRETIDHYEPFFSGVSTDISKYIRPEDGPGAPFEKVQMIRNLYMDQKWFQRAWVQQEISLAKTAVVQWGLHTFVWSDLIEFVVTQCYTAYEGPRVAGFIRWMGLVYDLLLKIWVTFDNKTSWVRERPYLSLFADAPGYQACDVTNTIDSVILLLSKSRTLQANDARDHIYAFIGHPDMQKFLEYDIGDSISVDYTLDASELFLRLARMLLTVPRSLNALSAVINGTRTASTPSWVPQWDDPTHCSRHSLLDSPRGTFRDIYFASRNLSCDLLFEKSPGEGPVPFCLHGNTLQTCGLSLDQITHVSDGFDINEFLADTDARNDISSPRPLNPVEQFWRGAVKIFSETSSPYDDNWKAFACTLAVGRTFDGGSSFEANWPTEAPNFRAFLERHCRFKTCELHELFGEAPTVSSANGDWSRFCVELRYSFERKFFVTSKGYMGLGPTDIELGDEVCVLSGAIVPLVLRKVPEAKQYKLSGECYVHGIMQGQAVEMWRTEGRAYQTFDIV